MLEPVRLRDGLVGHLPAGDVDALGERRILGHGHREALDDAPYDPWLASHCQKVAPQALPWITGINSPTLK